MSGEEGGVSQSLHCALPYGDEIHLIKQTTPMVLGLPLAIMTSLWEHHHCSSHWILLTIR